MNNMRKKKTENRLSSYPSLVLVEAGVHKVAEKVANVQMV